MRWKKSLRAGAGRRSEVASELRHVAPSSCPHAGQKGDDIVEIFITEGVWLVYGHQRFAALLEGAQLVFVEEINLLARINHLHAEAVFVESHAFDFLSLGGHDRDGFVFLGKFFGGFGQSPGEAAAGIANRIDDGGSSA